MTVAESLTIPVLRQKTDDNKLNQVVHLGFEREDFQKCVSLSTKRKSETSKTFTLVCRPVATGLKCFILNFGKARRSIIFYLLWNFISSPRPTYR